MSLLASWWDGAAVESLPPQTRALHYGDGVFRTMLFWQGTIDAREWQLRRLQEDAQRLHISVAVERLERMLDDIELPDSAVVKMMVIRGGVARGYAPQPDAEPHVAVFVHSLPRFPDDYWEQGIDAVTLDAPLAAHPGLAGVKHCNRLEQVLAAHELGRYPAQEGFCRAPSGGFQCGTRSNLFWQEGSQLLTPRIEDCGVRGVTRDRIIAAANDVGTPVQEAAAPGLDTLLAADAILVSNSIFGIWLVQRLNGHTMPRSQMARDWMQHLAHPGFHLADPC